MQPLRNSWAGRVRHHHVLVVVFALAILGGVQWWRVEHAETISAVFDSTPDAPSFGVQGELSDLIKDDTTLYMAGNFEAVGKPSSGLALISKSTGMSTDDEFPDGPNNNIYAAVSDEEGGYFIGGEFTEFGGETRNYIARISSDGTVDEDFDPDVDSAVYALAYDEVNDIVYAGGSFLNVNGGSETRNALAAFDGETGAVTAFDAGFNPGNFIRALVLDGTTLYAGGAFTSVNGGTTRNRLAAFDTSTGLATSFDPNIDSGATAVRALLLDGTTLYAGGDFTSVNGGTTRNRLAAFDTGTGLVSAFDPDVSAYSVEAMAYDAGSGVLYAGGQFNSVNGGTTRTLVAAFDGATGAVEPFTVSEIYNNGAGNSGVVTDLLLDGNTLYIGGRWTTSSLAAVNTNENLYAVDAVTGEQIEFSKPGNEVGALVDAGSDLFIAGQFRTVDSTMVNNLAAIDMETADVTEFDVPGGEVKSIALDSSNGILYAGGDFTTVLGCGARNNLAAFDVTTGSCTTFDPDVDDVVYELLLDGSTLYTGGFFTAVNVGAETRNGVAAFDTGTGLATSFDPNLYHQAEGNPGGATSFVLDGSTLYVGGYFDEVNGGTPRNSLAAFDVSSGIANSFDPNLYDQDEGSVGQVSSLLLEDTTLYVGGTFTEVNGGTARNHLAAFDTSDGMATGFDPYPDDSVLALLLDGSTLYAGGGFTSVNDGDYDRNSLAAFDTTTGVATSFNPDVNGEVRVLVAGSLIAGGTFVSVGGDVFAGIAVFPELVIPDPLSGDFDSTPNDLNWGTDGDVSALAKSEDGILYFGGTFSLVGRVVGAGTVLDTQTGEPEAVFPQFNDGVSVAILDGEGGWYVGGQFTQCDGITRNRLAHVLSDGTLDEDFDPNINGEVNALVLDGTTLYVGGSFDLVNGSTARNNLAAFDTTTGLATSFDPDVMTIAVYALALDGTTLYAGGSFDTVNGGTTRNYLAAFDTGTGLATSFNPNLNNVVRTLVLDGTTLYAGGYFTTVNGGTTRGKLAAFDTGTGLVTSFNAGIDPAFSDVYTLVLDGTTLYVGGDIDTVNVTVPRSNLAAFDTTTGTVTSFDPDVGHRVHTLVLDGTTLYAGGIFSDVNGGTPRAGLAAFDTGTGIATDFAPEPDSSVRALALDGERLFVGGSFVLINTETRNNLAAIDTSTDELTDFDPNLDGQVATMILDNGTLFVGGYFSDVNGGTTRNRLAAFDATSGVVTAFDPNINGFGISDIVLSGTTLYAGGQFTDVNGGTARNYLAAFDTGTGLVTSFDPDLDNDAYALAIGGTTLYVGGSFSTVNQSTTPVTRNGIAAFDTVTGAATSFDPDIGLSDAVYELLLDGTVLYVGGSITEVNGGSDRRNLAAFNTVTGVANGFDPNLNCQCGGGGNVVALALDGTTLYAGGEFDEVNGGTPRVNFAAFDTTDGVVTDFDVDPDGQVYALLLDDLTLYMGGEFTAMNQGTASLLRSHLAAFERDAASPTPTPDEGSDQTGSFINPSLLPLSSVTPVYTPDPAGGITLEDAAASTTSRLVKISYDSPFDDSGVTVRTVNADALTPADRELLYQQRYGTTLETPKPDEQLRSGGTLQVLDTAGNVELQSGSVRAFAPAVTGWDLCAGAASCPSGTYTVYAQFIKPTAGVAAVLGAIGDQVSDIYSDSIEYVTSSPLTSPVTTPAMTAVSSPTTPAPVTSSQPSSPPQPSQTVTASPSPATPVVPALTQLGDILDGAVPGRPFVSSALLATLMLLPFAVALFSSHRYAGQTTYASLFVLQSILEAFGLRKKRRNWGTIYDALTKRPIPFGKVELRDSANRVLETRHADAQGRYGFLITPQSLNATSLDVTLHASVPGYTFPSATVTSDPDFFVYDHVYKGGVVTLQKDALVNFNIPLDRAEGPQPLSLYATHRRLRGAANGILGIAFWAGLVLLPLNAILYPSVWTVGLLAVFIVANSIRVVTELFRPYGVVNDADGTPMPFALLILQEPDGTRISFTVSDERGRYFLPVPAGKHQLVIHSASHISPQRTVTLDLSTRKGWLSKQLTL